MKHLKEITDWNELKNEVVCGDCLEGMKLIPDGVVDAVICDPPYGTTACSWDTVIPFDKMWEQLNRIIKPNGAIVLFGSQPFTSALVMSNVKNYRHGWIYQKKCASNFALAKYQPMKEHEDISVFGKNKVHYYPLKEKRTGSGGVRVKNKFSTTKVGGFISMKEATPIATNLRYPSSVRLFNNRATGDRGLHPTQKPIALIEYLIKTYTNEGELVVDFTMGSWTTGKGCKNLNRDFIGFELSEKYCEIGEKRLQQQNLF